ncbi:MAG: DNA gyrase/topoisomerase IV subunit A, partial [Muribaculaceae bacterium]|nr:DNA gyrase/topoisomerase IV subunit A [Muribaculaceae bacterium]
MNQDPNIPEELEPTAPQSDKPVHNKPYTAAADVVRHQLKGMYQSWFLEYASYVILERAVPHIDDGLKPVQRRILHSMETLDDGRFNKVANIVGNTMQYHPHGDASIGDALVQLGQKDLLVETQGNWGNILTGASAAAPRYIEARLSPFALEILFSEKVTDWTVSYDGRKREPVTLPAKFPLLLAQGAEGIAVGLASKILPHNFNEILDAAIAYLQGEEFELYPDFPTGGSIDVSRYNDGRRGGAVRIRAKIEKIDNRTLAVTEIPYGKTTGTVIDSILKAFEKGKIKIRKVEDNTAEQARIVVHLLPGTSSDKTIDALYAFTDCEESISPNCCVISQKKPHFLGVSDVLRHSADLTRDIFRRELEIRLGELRERLFYASLERIFIEKRIYKDREYETASDIDAAVSHIGARLEEYVADFIRPVTRDDILRLVEIKMKRIFRFSSDEADNLIERLNEQ